MLPEEYNFFSLLFFSFLFFSFLLLNSCQQNDVPPERRVAKRLLTPEEQELKMNIAAATKILAQVITMPEVHAELKQLASAEHDANAVRFADLLKSETIASKGVSLTFGKLREAVLGSLAQAKLGNP